MWCETRIAEELSGSAPFAGADLLAGKVRPVVDALLDVLAT